MHHQLKQLFIESAEKSLTTIPEKLSDSFQLERTKKKSFGDFSCNIAMVNAKNESVRPINLAKSIINKLAPNELIEKLEIAGPGFINIFLKTSVYHKNLKTLFLNQDSYGHQKKEVPRKILVEFVSANPTGPLHVGHGRGAAFGSTLINILKASGDKVDSEYYVNDGGRQMDILAISIYLKYLIENQINICYPSNCYQAKYIEDMASIIKDEHLNKFVRQEEKIITICLDEEEDEKKLDSLIQNTKNILQQDYDIFFNLGLKTILDDIHDDLSEFGVNFDNWISEKKFLTNGSLEKTVGLLEKNGFTYNKDGALWFAAEKCGDDKDRVLIRDNGTPTYFTCDLAYHLDKLDRDYDHLINVWGADHHGYIQRVKSGIRSAGYDDSKLEVLLIQFVSLFKDSKKLQMSTRSGNYITLRDLRNEVGNDAARIFYISRSNDQHLDFDMTLAQKQSNENPVFYIQYAHARIVSIIDNQNLSINDILHVVKPELLDNEHEMNLIIGLSKFPEIIEHSSKHFAPQHVVAYLTEISSLFHTNYAANKVLVDDQDLQNARIMLYFAVKCTIKNGLKILGVEALEKM